MLITHHTPHTSHQATTFTASPFTPLPPPSPGWGRKVKCLNTQSYTPHKPFYTTSRFLSCVCTIPPLGHFSSIHATVQNSSSLKMSTAKIHSMFFTANPTVSTWATALMGAATMTTAMLKTWRRNLLSSSPARRRNHRSNAKKQRKAEVKQRCTMSDDVTGENTVAQQPSAFGCILQRTAQYGLWMAGGQQKSPTSFIPASGICVLQPDARCLCTLMKSIGAFCVMRVWRTVSVNVRGLNRMLAQIHCFEWVRVDPEVPCFLHWICLDDLLLFSNWSTTRNAISCTFCLVKGFKWH